MEGCCSTSFSDWMVTDDVYISQFFIIQFVSKQQGSTMQSSREIILLLMQLLYQVSSEPSLSDQLPMVHFPTEALDYFVISHLTEEPTSKIVFKIQVLKIHGLTKI